MTYYIVLGLKGILTAFLVVSVGYSVLHLLFGYKKMRFAQVPKSLHNAFSSKLCAFIATLLIMSYVLMHLFQTSMYGGASISLNYIGASNGLNPNGTRYKMSEILSDEVLEKAIQIGALDGISIDDLRDCLEVIQPVQGGTQSEEDYHISTEFFITYQATKKTIQLNPDTVARLVAYAYKDRFIDQYVNDETILNLDFSGIDDLDYIEICDFLENRANNIILCADSFGNENASFVSEATGEKFYALSNKVTNYKDTAIENLRSFILVNGLSKDRDRYIQKLVYEDAKYNLNYQKDKISSQIRLDAIDKYENDLANVVLIPTYAQDHSFYMSQTALGIDYYAADANSYADMANDVYSKITFNDYVAEQLRKSAATKEDYVNADRTINAVVTQLNSFAKLTGETAYDYRVHSSDHYLGITVYALHPSYVKSALIAFALFFSTYLLSFVKNMRKREDI